MLLKNTGVRVQLELLLIIRLAKYSIPTSFYIQVIGKENLGVSEYSPEQRFQ